jgi:hypothetical protein
MAGASYDVGSAFLQIVPSFDGVAKAISAEAAEWGENAGEAFADAFKTTVNTELKDLEAAKVDADTSAASAKIQELRAEIDTLNTEVDLGIDEGDTQEKLAALQAELAALELEHPEITVGVNTDEAGMAFEGLTAGAVEGTAAVEELGAGVEEAGAGIDEFGAAGDEAGAAVEELGAGAGEAGAAVDELGAGVLEAGAGLEELGEGADTASKGLEGAGESAESAGEGASYLMGGLIAVGVALVPLGGLFLAAFAAVPALISGATLGIGTLFAALEPVVKAVEAFSATKAPAASSGGSDPAQTAITNATAQRNAAYSVQQAQEALTNAQVNGAEAVTTAQTDAANATEQAANKVISANQALVSSEQAVTQAQFNETQAQEAVVAARTAAANQLQDYTDQLADNAISAQQDALNLTEAQQAYAQATDPGTTATYDQQQQAGINLQQAQQAQKDLSDQNSQLEQTATAAFAAGVSGAQSVIDAENQLQQATIAVANAIQQQGDDQTAVSQASAAAAQQQITNQQNITKAQKDNAQGVSDAEKALEQALANQKSAFQTAAAPAAGAASALATYSSDMAKLTPAGQKFVDFVTGTLEPAFTGLSAIAQNALLPLAQSGLTAMIPFFDTLNTLVYATAKGIGDFVKNLGDFAGTQPGLTQLQQMFANGTTFMGDLATAANLFIQAFVSVGSQSAPIVNALGTGIVNIVKAFLNWTNDGGFQGFLTWVRENGPSIVTDFGNFIKAAGDLLVALTPLGTYIDSLVSGFSKFVSWLVTSDPLFLPVAAGIAAIALAVVALSSPIVLAVAAAALLVLGITELATHWQAVWSNIKNWSDDAWTAINTTLFQPIESFFTKTIPDAFDSFVNFCEALPGRALTALGDFADKVWGALVIGADWLNTHVWTPIENFFAGLPDKIGNAAVHMWDGIAAAFATVYDEIVTWWNDLTFSMQPVKVLGVTIFPGFDVSTPNLPLIPIPKYHTGGVVQGEAGVEQLAMLMPGEIVTPANMTIPNGLGQSPTELHLTNYIYGLDLTNRDMVQAEITDAFAQFAEALQPTKVA